MTDQPIDASHYVDHRAFVGPGSNLWENNGWMVWDRWGDDDMLLWVSPYRIVGRQPGGPFAVEDVALSQTLLLRTRLSGAERHHMNDTPFVACGYDLGDHLPGADLDVSLEGSRARWTLGDRTFEASPPTWRVTGRHADVDVDLQLEAIGRPLWLTSPAADARQDEEMWFFADAVARGRVTYGAEVMDVDGHASHERHVHLGTKYDPVRLLSARGLSWHSAAVEGTTVLVYSRPSLDLAWARVVAGDGASDARFDASEGHYEINETHHWVDPQSRLRVPCQWRTSFRGRAGRLDIQATAFARAYYLWPHFRHGCTVLYWWLADASVEFELAGGASGSFHGVQYVVHDNRLLYRNHRGD